MVEQVSASQDGERIETGITGLDEMIEGGFRKYNTILVTGGCGTGKSTLAMQYIYEGAKMGQPGVYISFEEYPEDMKTNFARYGWDIASLEMKGMVKIMHIEPQDVMRLIKEDYGSLVARGKDTHEYRIVIDSISSVEAMVESNFETRKFIMELSSWLRENKCTSIIVSETEQGPSQYVRHGAVEFAVDGVIVLYNIRRKNTRHRALEILKMRGTNHDSKIVPFSIKKGIDVLPDQKFLSDI